MTPARKYEQMMKHFVKNFQNAEIVEECIPKNVNIKNADYFFERRSIVAEFKCLEVDSNAAVLNYLVSLVRAKEIPPFRGPEIRIGDVLGDHPKQEQFRSKIMDIMCSSLEGALEKANRQIRDTRNYFKLPSASGMFILVNFKNTILQPHVAVNYINLLLAKKKSQGGTKPRYEHIDCVIYTTEIHNYKDGEKQLIPLVAIENHLSPKYNKETENFLRNFQSRWAKYRGVELMDGDAARVNLEYFKNLPFKEIR